MSTRRLGFAKPSSTIMRRRICLLYTSLPEFTPGHERGQWVVEAKKSIPTAKQLETDCAQASSYALRLNAHGFMLVAQEGVWTATKEDDFENMAHYSWEDLREDDIFAKLDVYKRQGWKISMAFPLIPATTRSSG